MNDKIIKNVMNLNGCRKNYKGLIQGNVLNIWVAC